jgi:hypothetical protein
VYELLFVSYLLMLSRYVAERPCRRQPLRPSRGFRIVVHPPVARARWEDVAGSCRRQWLLGTVARSRTHTSGAIWVRRSCLFKRIGYLLVCYVNVRGTCHLPNVCPLSFAKCVSVQAFSGLFPFDRYRDETVVLQVVSGARPGRPRGSLGLGLTDGIWKMMQECWGSSDRRWTISCIVSHLELSIAPTVRAAGPDERAAARRPAFTPVPRNVPSSASQPESETRVTRPNCGRNFLRKLDRLFRS